MSTEKFRGYMEPLLPEDLLARSILERCQRRGEFGLAMGGDIPGAIMPSQTAAEILSWKEDWRPYWPDFTDFLGLNEPIPYLLLPQNIDQRDHGIITALFRYMKAVRTPQFGSSALILPARFRDKEIYDSFSPEIFLDRERRKVGFQAPPNNIIGDVSRRLEIQAFKTIYSPLGVYLAGNLKEDAFTHFFVFSGPVDPDKDLKRF